MPLFRKIQATSNLPLTTPHHFLALLSSSNWGTTVPLATPETSCNVRERRPWRMFHSTRTWRGSTVAWPSSTWERSTLASLWNLDEKMCKLSQSVRLTINFGKLMRQPTLLKLPKCILRVAEKLFRHPLKSQAPGCKHRLESIIIIMDEHLMNPFPLSSKAAVYIAFTSTQKSTTPTAPKNGGPINPTCIARQRPNSHHHDPKSVPQPSCHPRRTTIGPKKSEPHGFCKKNDSFFHFSTRTCAPFSMSSSWFSQVSSALRLHCRWPLELLPRPFSKLVACFVPDKYGNSTQDGICGYQLLPDYLFQLQSLLQSMLPIPFFSHIAERAVLSASPQWLSVIVVSQLLGP